MSIFQITKSNGRPQIDAFILKSRSFINSGRDHDGKIPSIELTCLLQARLLLADEADMLARSMARRHILETKENQKGNA